TGPADAVRGQPRTFTLMAGGPGLPAGTIFTFLIDWDGDGTPDQTVIGPSGTTVTHAFPNEGSFTIGVTAIAPGGASAGAGRPIDISIVATQPDPTDPSKTVLAVGAAPDGDVLLVFPGDPGMLQVYVGGQWMTEPAPSGHVLAYGQDGNDVI